MASGRPDRLFQLVLGEGQHAFKAHGMFYFGIIVDSMLAWLDLSKNFELIHR